MKSLILPVLMLALSPLAHADVLCGRLTSEESRPVCKGFVCSHAISTRYLIERTDGEKVDLSIASQKISEEVNELIGEEVCAKGEYKKGPAGNTFFNPTALRRSAN